MPAAMSTKFMGNSLIKLGKKVIAVGKNYSAHIQEMGQPAPSAPVLFLKPTSSYIRKGESIKLPKSIGPVHHEVELGVVIGKPGKDIKEDNWEKHVAGYVLALDMTARKLQDDAKAQGLPWTTAKCYDTFTPISEFIPRSKVKSWDELEIWCSVEDELRQKAMTGEMIHSVPFLISYISKIMKLEEGDVIITGTPSGVGPVEVNQTITAGIEGLVTMKFPVKERREA